MTYEALIVDFDKNSDQKVIVRISNYELCCFIVNCPFDIYISRSYSVNLSLEFFDNPNLSPLDKINFYFKRVNNGLLYDVCGIISQGSFRVDSIVFFDEIFSDEFHYLDEKFAIIRNVRINIDFD